jgi:SAM-dependent methyltransferase
MDPAHNAAARFAALSALFDAASQRHLADRGVAPGWHCLEVGGGGGSIARWLGHRVGPTGRVLATDVETRFLEQIQLPNVDVRCHDITRDALPERAFDLIHTRMVLLHLSSRDQVLPRLMSALKPWGWLVCEEFDRLSAPPDPDASPGEVVLKTHEAMARAHRDQGGALQYGRVLFGRFRGMGLRHLGAEARLVMVQAGSWGASLLRASYEQRRHAMIGAGYVTDQEFDADVARLNEPGFMMPSSLMWTVWGRRSGEGPCADS